ncbi:MAG: YggT family protein [Dehalococcoidia bacterium]
MSNADIALIIDRTIFVLIIAIIARSLLSFFMDPRHVIFDFLATITEPILAPIRRVMPRMGMFDLSPLVAIILLQVLGRVIHNALVG